MVSDVTEADLKMALMTPVIADSIWKQSMQLKTKSAPQYCVQLWESVDRNRVKNMNLILDRLPHP